MKRKIEGQAVGNNKTTKTPAVETNQEYGPPIPSMWDVLRATKLAHVTPPLQPAVDIPNTDTVPPAQHALIYSSSRPRTSNLLPPGVGRVVIEDEFVISIHRPKMILRVDEPSVDEDPNNKPYSYVYGCRNSFEFEDVEFKMLQSYYPDCTLDNPPVPDGHQQYLNRTVVPPLINQAYDWADFVRKIIWQMEEANTIRHDLIRVDQTTKAFTPFWHSSQVEQPLRLSRDLQTFNVGLAKQGREYFAVLTASKWPLFTIYIENEANHRILYRIWLNLAQLDQAIINNLDYDSYDYNLLYQCLDEKHQLEQLAATIQYKTESAAANHIPNSDHYAEALQPDEICMPLHDYQRRSLMWMHQIEDDVAPKMVQVYPSSYLPIPNSRWAIAKGEYSYLSRYTFSDKHLVEPIETSYNIRGGILADEMGCGKTVTALALTVSRPLQYTNVESLVYPDQQVESYLPSRATLVFCPPNIVKQWLCEAAKFLDQKVEENPTTTRIMLEAVPGRGAIHLVRNKMDWNRLSYWEVMNAHMIIVSYRFVLGGSYHAAVQGLCDLLPIVDNPYSSKQTAAVVRQMIRRCDEDILKTQAHPILEQILWHRIIYDEYHEVSSQNTSIPQKFFSCLRAGSYWGLTGTPMVNDHERLLLASSHFLNAPNFLYSPQDAHHFIQNRVCRNNYKLELPPITHQVIWVKQSMTETALYQSFKNVRGINRADLVMACSHHQIAERLQLYLGAQTTLSGEPLTIDEVAARLQSGRQRHITELDLQQQDLTKHLTEMQQNHTKLEEVVEEHKTNLARLCEEETEYRTSRNPFVADAVYYALKGQIVEQELEMKTQSQEVLRLELLIAPAKQRLRNVQERHQQAETEYRFFNLFIQGFKEGTEMECPICVEPIAPNCLTVTPCGHEFCNTCIRTYYETKPSYAEGMCPTCKRPTRQNQLFALKEAQPNNEDGQEAGDEQQVDPLYNKYGTKLVALIRWLKSTLQQTSSPEISTRILLFSQFKRLSGYIARALGEMNINHLSVGGSTLERQKTIDKWRQQQEVQVLLLNAESSASGLNLTEATHVVLLHPFLAAGELGRELYQTQNAHSVAGLAAEHQCITRAYRQGLTHPVQVVRFGTVETLEEELVLDHIKNLENVQHIGRPIVIDE